MLSAAQHASDRIFIHHHNMWSPDALCQKPKKLSLRPSEGVLCTIPHPDFGETPTRKISDVCLQLRNWWRIFRGVVRTLQGERVFQRPTPTPPPFANGSVSTLYLWGFPSQRIFIHRCYILCLVTGAGSGNRPSSAHIGVGICRILDMDFGEHPFHALG